jgi:hypothetical protein
LAIQDPIQLNKYLSIHEIPVLNLRDSLIHNYGYLVFHDRHYLMLQLILVQLSHTKKYIS